MHLLGLQPESMLQDATLPIEPSNVTSPVAKDEPAPEESVAQEDAGLDMAHLPTAMFNSHFSNDVYRKTDDLDFGFSGSVANSMDSPDAAKYSRARVAWRYTRHGKVSRPITTPPEQWTSSKKAIPWPKVVKKAVRKFWNNYFNEIICVIYSLQVLAGWCYHTRASCWMSFVVIAVCYLEENIRFMLTHFTFHTGFWEFDKLADMSIPIAAACRHHNGEPWIYMAHSTEYRMYYFFERPYWFSHGWMSLFTPQAIQGQHNIKSLLVWATCGFEVMMIHRAWTVFNAVMQQIVHEWYHTPRRYRSQQFIILFPVLYAMEALGVIDTAHHKLHHKSDGTDEHHTEQWFDALVPHFFEVVASKIYQWLMRDETKAYERAISLHFWGTRILHSCCTALIVLASSHIVH